MQIKLFRRIPTRYLRKLNEQIRWSRSVYVFQQVMKAIFFFSFQVLRNKNNNILSGTDIEFEQVLVFKVAQV